MDKNIALILALSLTPSTIFMFCIHYSSPVPRAPFPVSRFPFPVSRFLFPTSRSPQPAQQALAIELLRESWSESKGNGIDLFSLHVLFSQYRSCDNTLENCLFQIYSSYSCAYVRIIYEQQRVKFLSDLYWENKTYKLKRSILSSQLSRRTRAETLAWQATSSIGRTSIISPS